MQDKKYKRTLVHKGERCPKANAAMTVLSITLNHHVLEPTKRTRQRTLFPQAGRHMKCNFATLYCTFGQNIYSETYCTQEGLYICDNSNLDI